LEELEKGVSIDWNEDMSDESASLQLTNNRIDRMTADIGTIHKSMIILQKEASSTGYSDYLIANTNIGRIRRCVTSLQNCILREAKH
jgi:hypothetical protein